MDDAAIRDDLREITRTLGDFRQEVGEHMGTILANQKNMKERVEEHAETLKDHADKIDSHSRDITRGKTYLSAAGMLLAGLEAWFHKISPWLFGGGVK